MKETTASPEAMRVGRRLHASKPETTYIPVGDAPRDVAQTPAQSLASIRYPHRSPSAPLHPKYNRQLSLSLSPRATRRIYFCLHRQHRARSSCYHTISHCHNSRTTMGTTGVRRGSFVQHERWNKCCAFAGGAGPPTSTTMTTSDFRRCAASQGIEVQV